MRLTKRLPWRAILLLWAAVLSSIAGAAAFAADAAGDPADPFEPVNRGVFRFNDSLDRWLLKPVARGYDWLLPDPVQRGIGNMFNNLTVPGVALNQFLQGKPVAGVQDVGRFVVNSTVGVAGYFDVAAKNGMPRHEEDFGQTFAVWGAAAGPFLMIPLGGPATTTHAVGMVLDAFTNPLLLISPNRDRYIAFALNAVDSRAQLLSAEKLISGDKYLFIRDAYLQRRDFLINDGVVEEDPFLDDFDE